MESPIYHMPLTTYHLTLTTYYLSHKDNMTWKSPKGKGGTEPDTNINSVFATYKLNQSRLVELNVYTDIFLARKISLQTFILGKRTNCNKTA